MELRPIGPEVQSTAHTSPAFWRDIAEKLNVNPAYLAAVAEADAQIEEEMTGAIDVRELFAALREKRH